MMKQSQYINNNAKILLKNLYNHLIKFNTLIKYYVDCMKLELMLEIVNSFCEMIIRANYLFSFVQREFLTIQTFNVAENIAGSSINVRVGQNRKLLGP